MLQVYKIKINVLVRVLVISVFLYCSMRGVRAPYKNAHEVRFETFMWDSHRTRRGVGDNLNSMPGQI